MYEVSRQQQDDCCALCVLCRVLQAYACVAAAAAAAIVRGEDRHAAAAQASGLVPVSSPQHTAGMSCRAAFAQRSSTG
jgi:hypothetical protein